jgi:hypothetical protein
MSDSDESKKPKGDFPKSGELPRLDFSTFILSLGTSALYELGLVDDPVSGLRGDPEPLLAKQTIDTLEMLREKTLPQLDEEERKLIDSLLYELRIKYVEACR